MSEDSQPKTVQPSQPGWHYKPEQSPAVADDPKPAPRPAAAPRDDQKEITWTASEYIAHHKGTSWYGAVVAVGVLLAVIVYFLTHDKISTTMVLVVTILFCVAAARKPRVLMYSVSQDGISIGQRFHSFGEFRSFSVEREGAFANIELLPLQRFMPLTSIYCSPNNEDNVIDALAAYIPFEERSHSYVDRFARHIRF